MAEDTTKPTEIEHVEAVVVQPNALEMMERASIDIQIATAHKFPRSLDVFYKRATAMVSLDEETARSCLYRRPVGKDASGKMKYAEGESIRLAEIVAAAYGNIRVGGIITEMTTRYVKAVGVAHDLESNYAVKAEVVESTVNKHGVPFSERMRVVVAKAAQSKAIRDAIFRIVPKSLCKPLATKAKDVAKGDAKTFEAKRKAVVEWIDTLKVKAERVWAAIGVKGPKDIGYDELLLLAGLKTAIEEKDVTVSEAFPKLEDESKASKTTDRIKGAMKTEAEPPAPEREKPVGDEPSPEQKEKMRKRAAKKSTKKTEKKDVEEPKAQEETAAPPTEQTAPEPNPEPPTEAPAPKETPEKEPEAAPEPQPEPEPEPAPEPEPVKEPEPEKQAELVAQYKCDRCKRDVHALNDNGKCPYCFGACTKVA